MSGWSGGHEYWHKFQTIGNRISREEIRKRWTNSLKEGKPIIGSAAGYGIIASCSELAGIDFTVIYATGRSRAMGIGTASIGDPNQVVLDIAHEILFVVKDTPVMAGIKATDPIRKIDKLLQAYADLGFSGVFGFPTVGSLPEWQRETLERAGQGIGREVEVAKMARDDFKLWTIWYVWNLEDVARFAKICDALAVHVGWTTGGLTGKYAHLGVEKACERIQEFYEEAKKANPDVFVLAHGGPFGEPESTKAIYELTDAEGFVGASTVERIPVEKAVMNAVKTLKSMPMPRKKKKK